MAPLSKKTGLTMEDKVDELYKNGNRLNHVEEVLYEHGLKPIIGFIRTINTHFINLEKKGVPAFNGMEKAGEEALAMTISQIKLSDFFDEDVFKSHFYAVENKKQQIASQEYMAGLSKKDQRILEKHGVVPPQTPQQGVTQDQSMAYGQQQQMYGQQPVYGQQQMQQGTGMIDNALMKVGNTMQSVNNTMMMAGTTVQNAQNMGQQMQQPMQQQQPMYGQQQQMYDPMYSGQMQQPMYQQPQVGGPASQQAPAQQTQQPTMNI